MDGLSLVTNKTSERNKVIKIGDVKFGEDIFPIIAGPCAVESRGQIEEIALELKNRGADVLRGGTFKPRTNPYSFQGLKEEGMRFLSDAGKKSGLPVITEIVDEYSLYHSLEFIDAVQVGSRNMQNYSLLKKVGKLNIPVILKRGFYSTISEWLNAAEYILYEGNNNVILCERGIRTVSEETRNTLDISAVLVIKKLSSFPIIIDPSHACGIREYVLPLSLAAAVVGADGLMVEVHMEPDKSVSDARQTIDVNEFTNIKNKIKSIFNAKIDLV